MRTGVIVNHCFDESVLGVPQGGPLSPLLRNVMSEELDKVLERLGHPFVRYADDGLISCKSKRTVERTWNHIICFIEATLFLKVNKEKTSVGYVRGMELLGYSFYVTKVECRSSVHPKTYTNLKFY